MVSGEQTINDRALGISNQMSSRDQATVNLLSEDQAFNDLASKIRDQTLDYLRTRHQPAGSQESNELASGDQAVSSDVRRKSVFLKSTFLPISSCNQVLFVFNPLSCENLQSVWRNTTSQPKRFKLTLFTTFYDN